MRLFRESSSFVIGEPLSDFGMNSDRQLTAALSQFGAEASRLTDGQSQLEADGDSAGGSSVPAEIARGLPGSSVEGFRYLGAAGVADACGEHRGYAGCRAR